MYDYEDENNLRSMAEPWFLSRILHGNDESAVDNPYVRG